MVKLFLKTVITLVLLGISVTTTAQNWPPTDMTGTGTETDPWQITTPAHLEALANYVNTGNGDATCGEYYKLINDIDLSDYAEGEGWMPIGIYSEDVNFSNFFCGNFDGNGKLVKKLTINRPSINGVTGLFGYVCTDASIKNLGIENCDIVGGQITGGLVGFSECSITGCYITGSVRGRDCIGGLVGCNGGTITNSFSTANVSGSGYVGGLVGCNGIDNTATISYCYATGNVSSTGEYVGGLVGSNIAIVRNCVAANDTVITTYSIPSSIGFVFGYSVSFFDGGTNYVSMDMRVLYDTSILLINENVLKARSYNELRNEHFYTATFNWFMTVPWDFSTVWDICDGKTLPWLQWQNISCETTGIPVAGVENFQPLPVITGYYTLTGQRLSQEPSKGFYIIKYSDGTAKKVVR